MFTLSWSYKYYLLSSQSICTLIVFPSLKFFFLEDNYLIFICVFFFVPVDNYFQILQQPHSTSTHLVQTYEINFFKAVTWHLPSSAPRCLGWWPSWCLGNSCSLSSVLDSLFPGHCPLFSWFIWWKITPRSFLRKNIGEVKCLSSWMSENTFIFPECLRSGLSWKRILEKNFFRGLQIFIVFWSLLISLMSFLFPYVTCFSL